MLFHRKATHVTFQLHFIEITYDRISDSHIVEVDFLTFSELFSQISTE